MECKQINDRFKELVTELIEKRKNYKTQSYNDPKRDKNEVSSLSEFVSSSNLSGYEDSLSNANSSLKKPK